MVAMAVLLLHCRDQQLHGQQVWRCRVSAHPIDIPSPPPPLLALTPPLLLHALCIAAKMKLPHLLTPNACIGLG
jgi:hypothetical protein